jgi:hypothetical protein
MARQVCWFSFLLVAVLQLASAQSRASDGRGRTLLNSMAWYNEWIQRIRLGAEPIHCTGYDLMPTETFFCTPPGIEIVVWRETVDLSISQVHIRPVTSLTDVLQNARNSFGGSLIGRETKVDLTVRSWSEVNAERKRDIRQSVSFYTSAKVFIDRSTNLSGYTTYYPWLNEGDPEYHVYSARNGLVEIVWLYSIYRGNIDLSPSFAFDKPHKNIPARATSNLADVGRWYRIEKHK